MDNTVEEGDHGYIQKGNRYFWQVGAATKFDQGFKSKEDCDNWINAKRESYGLDWRVGYMVKFKKFHYSWLLVDRKGNEVKCF